MQKIQFPMPYMNITQGINIGTHKGTYALDCAGSDSGIDFAIAPFTGVIKKKWANGNTVWLESTDKVLYADNTIDYATVSLTHDNNISNLTVGQVIQQGARFYEEGTAGYATGNHIHLEIGRGKFVGTGWYQNEFGTWTINNKYLPYNAFFVDGINILNGGGYNWKKSVTNATEAQIKQAYIEILERPADAGAIVHYKAYTIAFVRADLVASNERRLLLARKAADAAKVIADKAAADAKAAQDVKDAAAKLAAIQEAERLKAIQDAKNAKALEDARIADEKARQEAEKVQESNHAFIERLKAIITAIIKFLTNLKG